MRYLKDVIKENGHKLVKYNECKVNRKYQSVFDYSVQNGGTFDGFRYYNDYVVDVTE